MSRPSLHTLLEPSGFRFRMGLTQVDSADWFAARRSPERARRRLDDLDRHPSRLGRGAGVDLAPVEAELARLVGVRGSFESIASRLAVDTFVAKRPEAELVAIAVAHPSGFAPERMLGRSVSAIHGAVPGLAPTLGSRIGGFLDRVTPGRGFARANLGLANGPGLDRHPDAQRAPIDEATGAASLVLRIEEQLFHGCADHVLFAVHLVEVRATDLDPDERTRLAAWVASMPPEIAAYKGVSALRDRIHPLLGIPRTVPT